MRPTTILRLLAMGLMGSGSLAAIGDRCSASAGSGTCQRDNNCLQGFTVTGACPRDPANVKCCIRTACRAPYQNYSCRDTNRPSCSGGFFVPGYCPGPNGVQCCVR